QLLRSIAAIEHPLLEKSLQQFGSANQCVAQKPAVAEDDKCVVDEKTMAVEQAGQFASAAFQQALEGGQRAIGIGRVGQQREEGFRGAGGDLSGNAAQDFRGG